MWRASRCSEPSLLDVAFVRKTAHDTVLCAPDGCGALPSSVLNHSMKEHPLTILSPNRRVLKRAQYEAFEFSLYEDDILVRNESYADPENHEYRVIVEDGLPTHCTCPADARYPGPCKHRVAVAIRRPVLDAVRTMQLVADGGVPPRTDTEPETDETPCEYGCDEHPEAFPCWECVRTGRRSLPGEEEPESS